MHNKNTIIFNINSINNVQEKNKLNELTKYISYTTIEDNNNNIYVFEDNKEDSTIKELLKYKDTVQIEAYSNSGIIKTIDGIDKCNHDKLTKYTTKYFVDQITENNNKINQEKLEKEKKFQEEREKENIKSKINSNIIGKKFIDIEKQLKSNNITNYSVEYISSKMYSVGTIAFYEKIHNVYFIVKDNHNEDMIKMPVLKTGMIKNEIIKILIESGFENYECKTISSNLYPINTLHSYQFSAGTLLPKQIVIYFSICK